MNVQPIQPAEPEVKKLMLLPRVGMSSMVGIHTKNYPIEFGNYCSIHEGPYLCNMWAENLKEWARRNPDAGPIEVTEYVHAYRSLGMVTDSRLKDWCSAEPCITGHGWPSVAVMRLICGVMGVSTVNRMCGCEKSDESPQISETWKRPKIGEGCVDHPHTFRCHRCRRVWQEEPEPAADETTSKPTNEPLLKLTEATECTAFLEDASGFDVVTLHRVLPDETDCPEHKAACLSDEAWQEVIDFIATRIEAAPKTEPPPEPPKLPVTLSHTEAMQLVWELGRDVCEAMLVLRNWKRVDHGSHTNWHHPTTGAVCSPRYASAQALMEMAAGLHAANSQEGGAQ